MSAGANGPHVGLAVLCHRLDRQEDGSLDVLGIVDGVLLEPPSPTESDPLGLRPAAVLPLRLAVMLRAGAVRGRRAVRVVGHYPGGREAAAVDVTVEFTDERPVAIVSVPIELEVHHAGTYRFDVSVDDVLLTRVPLEVVFAPPPRP